IGPCCSNPRYCIGCHLPALDAQRGVVIHSSSCIASASEPKMARGFSKRPGFLPPRHEGTKLKPSCLGVLVAKKLLVFRRHEIRENEVCAYALALETTACEGFGRVISIPKRHDRATSYSHIVPRENSRRKRKWPRLTIKTVIVGPCEKTV